MSSAVDYPDGVRRETAEVEIELGDAVRPVLVRWTVRRESEGVVFGGNHSYALRTEDGVVLVDPYRIDAEANGRLAELIPAMSGGAAPLATLCTNSWHERAAYVIREQRGVPVWLPRAGTAEMDGAPDHLYDETTELPAGIRAVHLEDMMGGAALLARAATGEAIQFGGDSLMGGSHRPGHWREKPGLNLWLSGRHDRAAFTSRFGRLLDFDALLLCSAHGRPVPFRDRPTTLLARALQEGEHVEIETRAGTFPWPHASGIRYALGQQV